MKRGWPGELIARTGRVALIVPGVAMARRTLEYAVRNREYHRPAMPTPPFDYDTLSFWKKRLRTRLESFRVGVEYGFFMLPADDPCGLVLGDVTFSQVFRGPLSGAVLGYKLDRVQEGKGLMRESLEAALQFMFSDVKLHRIEANVRPENERSFRLLRRMGFVVEGFSRAYLKLDGGWRDHIRLARINPEHAGGNPASLDLRILGIGMPSEPVNSSD
ncbi:MAG: GNAT family N-acetyltransferase [bacterium]